MQEILDKPEEMKRKHHVVICLNDLEKQAIEKYCKKYHIKNRSKVIREAVITAVLQKFDSDYPSLFESICEEQKEKIKF